MDKYVEMLSGMSFDLLHIAQSFAVDNHSPLIEPAHLLRALLHKSAGLVAFIENTLDADYYYLVDWSEMRMHQCEKSPYKMKGVELSPAAKSAVKEADAIRQRNGQADIDGPTLLAALLTPGVAFSYEQLKTLPLTAEKVLCHAAPADVSAAAKGGTPAAVAPIGQSDSCVPMLAHVSVEPVIGLETEFRSLVEVLARRNRANVLIVGETGVGKTSLIMRLLQSLSDKEVPVSLASVQPYELDLITLAQGVSYKGEVEDRLKEILSHLSELEQPVLVIENFHRLEDKQSVLNGLIPVLKKVLQQRCFACLSSTEDHNGFIGWRAFKKSGE